MFIFDLVLYVGARGDEHLEVQAHSPPDHVVCALSLQKYALHSSTKTTQFSQLSSIVRVVAHAK
jgi:hypothetical protein